MGTETWLSPTYVSSEYFPEQYVVYRTDRCTTGGGVLLGINMRLMSQQVVTPLDVELVMATFTVTKRLSVLIGCCYRPPNTTEDYMHKVTAELRATQQRHQEAMYLLGGDLNLPDIDWRYASVAGHPNQLAINRGFLDTCEDIGLNQIVDFPTHSNPDHTLDSLLTNMPSLIQRCEPIHGVADHDAVLAITKLTSPLNKPIRRRIRLWKKANMEIVRQRITTFSTTFHEQYSSDTPVKEMWSAFSSEVHHIMADPIPSKWSTTRYNQPWVTTAIKRLARRKKKTYRKFRASGYNKDKDPL